ncbi:NAD-dependent epimerase/dehydratase family protein [Streptomyces sp. bgisy084]|uniref:NAD-dependent epimerase/dehydratase family protein n=1 Tax=unclassified Streptomyces TaxID=2593676 RepID=UPI003D75B413
MLILVTGGAGFIGSHHRHRPLTTGHEVRVIDSLLPAAHRTAPPIPDGVDCRHAHVRDGEAVADALRGDRPRPQRARPASGGIRRSLALFAAAV